MKINGIKDVFFDLDHTLWDFDKNSALTFDQIFKLNNLKIDLNKFLLQYVQINLNYWKLYRENKIDKEALRFGRLRDAFKAVNFDIDDALISKLSSDYIIHLTSFNYLLNNAIEVLNYLHKHYNLHIITNGFDEVQDKKLSKSNIKGYFKTVTNSEMAGVKKPNPKIFNLALELSKAQVSESIMIGDSYEADILGAKNVGMDAVFFNTNNMTRDTDVKRINDLIQLKNFL